MQISLKIGVWYFQFVWSRRYVVHYLVKWFYLIFKKTLNKFGVKNPTFPSSLHVKHLLHISNLCHIFGHSSSYKKIPLLLVIWSQALLLVKIHISHTVIFNVILTCVMIVLWIHNPITLTSYNKYRPDCIASRCSQTSLLVD